MERYFDYRTKNSYRTACRAAFSAATNGKPGDVFHVRLTAYVVGRDGSISRIVKSDDGGRLSERIVGQVSA